MQSILKCQLVVFFILGLTAVGCSWNPSLRGTVTYEDGTPLDRGIVYFASGNILARGAIQRDGTYVVGTDGQKDGLPRGEYKVYILGAEELIQGTGGQGALDSMGVPILVAPSFRQLVPRKYMTTEHTPLTCTIPAEKNKYDIVLEKPD